MANTTSPPKTIKKDGVWTVDGRPRETVTHLSTHTPPNIPGKILIAVLVTLPPNGATPPHTHSGAAVTGFMLSGRTLNQMNEAEPFESGPGETFFEYPGCRHVRCENVSGEVEARFFAHFVVDEGVVQRGGVEALVVLDADKVGGAEG